MTDRLVAAIISNDLNRATSLIASQVVDVDAICVADTGFGADRVAPLRFAAHCKRTAIVTMLLDKGAKVDLRSGKVNETALHSAARAQAADIVALLIARGANVSVRDVRQVTPLYIAAGKANEGIVVALIAAGALANPGKLALVMAATVSGSVIRLLLSRGIDVAALRDSGGGSALHVAAQRCRDDRVAADVIAALVNVARVDLSVCDHLGRPCCFIAVIHRNAAALRSLIAQGADINFRGGVGAAPLFAAITSMSSPLSLVMPILAAGVDGSANRFERYQVRCRSRQMAELLAAGVDFDTPIDGGEIDPHPGQVVARAAPTEEEIAAARRRIEHTRLELVRARALQVCIGLHSLRLDALQMCVVLQLACGPVAPLVRFHHWWTIATTAKHFKKQR
jgi:hypothetical protein